MNPLPKPQTLKPETTKSELDKKIDNIMAAFDPIKKYLGDNSRRLLLELKSGLKHKDESDKVNNFINNALNSARLHPKENARLQIATVLREQLSEYLSDSHKKQIESLIKNSTSQPKASRVSLQKLRDQIGQYADSSKVNAQAATVNAPTTDTQWRGKTGYIHPTGARNGAPFV